VKGYAIVAEQSTVKVVKGYIERGLAAIPVPRGSKNPNRKDWEKERWRVEDVPRLWNNGQNVGVLCGEASGWRVDVDCDTPEAVRLAPKFLPRSLKGGRENVPGSHWWYQSEDCETKPYFGTAGTRLLELRSNGCHTLVYPSIHDEDGDQYQWYRELSDKMARIDHKELRRKVNLLFTATIVARHMPPIGGRHDYANYLAGFLLRGNRLSEEEAELVLVSAWELFEDAGRDAIRDVQNSIKTAARRLEKNLTVRGGGALAVFHEDLPKAIANGWGWNIGSDEDPSYSWGAPEELPEMLPPVPAFDYRMLPDAFAPWVKDVAERMQVPPDFVAAPLMVALSCVVGRQVEVKPKRYDDWTVTPNLWGAIVGSPGLLKSPALKEALAPMNALISKATEAHKEALEEYELEREVSQARRQAYEERKKKLARSGDMISVQQHIEDNRPDDEPEVPKAHRYRTEDTTIEKLGELLNENPNGLMVFRDELVGFLRGLDRHGREGDRQFYLEGWNGDQSFNVDRIGRGSLHVEALCLSLLGGIQPGPLSRYVHDAGSGTVGDDGLLQRFQMLVWPDHPKTFENVDRRPDTESKKQITKVFEFADSLDYDKPEYGTPALKFNPESQDAFDAWRVALEEEVRSGELSPAMEAHKAKYRSLVPSLALLIEIADAALGPSDEIPSEITELSTQRAIAWCSYLEQHAKRLYSSAERPEVSSARALLRKLKAGEVNHGDPVRVIYRHQWTGLRDREEVEGALETLSDFGWLKVHRLESGGRPSEVVLLHPELRSRLRV
jgi:hypothetical protein